MEKSIKPRHSIIGRQPLELDRLLLGLPLYEIFVAFCYTTETGDAHHLRNVLKPFGIFKLFTP